MLGRSLPYPAPAAYSYLWHLSNCQREECTVCVRAHVRQSSRHIFPHFKWQPSCWYPCTAALGTGDKSALRTETCIPVCSHRIGGALIKAFATTRSNPSGFYMSVQKTSKLALAHCFVFQCEATQHIKWLTKPGWKENILFMAVNEREEWDVRDGRNLP